MKTRAIPAPTANNPTLKNTLLNVSKASAGVKSPASVSCAINFPSKCANDEERNQKKKLLDSIFR